MHNGGFKLAMCSSNSRLLVCSRSLALLKLKLRKHVRCLWARTGLREQLTSVLTRPAHSAARANSAQAKSNSKPRLSLQRPPRPGLTHCNSPIAQFPASVGGMVSLATLTGSRNCTDAKIGWRLKKKKKWEVKICMLLIKSGEASGFGVSHLQTKCS